MITLSYLRHKQENKCCYCGCEMTSRGDRRATIEHLEDKWSSPNHIKNEELENLAAACFKCNNSRGAARNIIARRYYVVEAANRGMKMRVSSTSSAELFKMFGPVPKELFK